MGPLSNNSRACLLISILFALLVFSGCQKKEETPKKTQKDQIPILTPATFEKTIRSQKGNVLVVNFFTTWCEPCREELPELVSLARSYKSKGVVVIGISLDKGGTKVLRPFLEKIKIPYPIYLGNQALMDSLKIQAIPTTYFYDKKGTRVDIVQGALTRERLAKKIEALLKAP